MILTFISGDTVSVVPMSVFVSVVFGSVSIVACCNPLGGLDCDLLILFVGFLTGTSGCYKK